ncbi:MAG: hypothetical protein ISR58_16165 [Anaerolineales bacterium]|nr:hypothetical protein [Chloroflexota bacterium]MBL6982710.1 hypothetical protein [Anaerolineales bacterium]
MTTDNPLPENPLTREQRRALAEVYGFLISLNRHESQETRNDTSATDNHVDEAANGVPKEAKTGKTENVSPRITHSQKDAPTVDQKESHRSKSTKDFNDDILPRSMHHPGVLLDSNTE